MLKTDLQNLIKGDYQARTTLINVSGGEGLKVCHLGNESKMAFWFDRLFKLSLAKATNMKRKAVFVSVLQIQSTGE